MGRVGEVRRLGVQSLAMPAFEPVWKDEDIWAVVAFVQKLPGMKDEDYAKLEKETQ
jgi:hypothetical protein